MGKRSFYIKYLNCNLKEKLLNFSVNVTKAETCLSEGVTLTEPSGVIR